LAPVWKGDAAMREKDPYFARAIDEIEKGIEQSLQEMLNQKKIGLKRPEYPTHKENSK